MLRFSFVISKRGAKLGMEFRVSATLDVVVLLLSVNANSNRNIIFVFLLDYFQLFYNSLTDFSTFQWKVSTFEMF